MADDGWTWGDLAGELWSRGIDPDMMSDAEIAAVLDARKPEHAADRIARGRDA